MRFALLGLALLLAGSNVACGPTGLQGNPPGAGDNDTTLGTGDVFEVRVYGEPDMSASYRVAQDGTIEFPYLGPIEVVDREPTDIARTIARRLEADGVLVRPQVSVMVTEYQSKRISIIGAVRNPGSFPLSSGLTAVQAIGLAGGFSDLANRDGTTITRRVDEQTRRYQVPVDQIMSGSREDLRIRAGDIVFVPERPF